MIEKATCNLIPGLGNEPSSLGRPLLLQLKLSAHEYCKSISVPSMRMMSLTLRRFNRAFKSAGRFSFNFRFKDFDLNSVNNC